MNDNAHKLDQIGGMLTKVGCTKCKKILAVPGVRHIIYAQKRKNGIYYYAMIQDRHAFAICNSMTVGRKNKNHYFQWKCKIHASGKLLPLSKRKQIFVSSDTIAAQPE